MEPLFPWESYIEGKPIWFLEKGFLILKPLSLLHQPSKGAAQLMAHPLQERFQNICHMVDADVIAGFCFTNQNDASESYLLPSPKRQQQD